MFLRTCIILAFAILLNSNSSYAEKKIVQEGDTFSLPELPDTLETPKDRANYLVSHYWNSYNFTATTNNPKATEQILVDFINILPHADGDVAATAILNLISHAERESEKEAFSQLLKLAEKYLYEMQSPFRQDEYYIPILRYLLSEESTTEKSDTESYLLRNRLERLLKNRQGELATDFLFTLASGEQRSLYEQEATPILLLFYDPECRNCKETIRELEASSAISTLLQQNKLKVLAVCLNNNTPIWKDYQQHFPSDWISVYDATLNIREKELYELRMLPTIYLLDNEKKVLLKDAKPDALENVMAGF